MASKSESLTTIVTLVRQNELSLDDVAKRLKGHDIHILDFYKTQLVAVYESLWLRINSLPHLIVCDTLFKCDFIYRNLKAANTINSKELVSFIKALDSSILLLNQEYNSEISPERVNSALCSKILGYDGFAPSFDRYLIQLEDPMCTFMTQRIGRLYDEIATLPNPGESSLSWQYVNAALLEYITKQVQLKSVAIHLAGLDDNPDDAQKYFEHWRANALPPNLDMSIVAKLATAFDMKERSYDVLIAEKQWLQRVYYNMKRYYQKMASSRKRQLIAEGD